jgi:hydroxyacyl-ACP dehydratase HTD2-like protein with hotdog domain
MKEAFELGNYIDVSSIAHKIKPSIDYICEIEDQELIRKIENKEGKSSSDDLNTDINNFHKRMKLYLTEAKDILKQSQEQTIADT